MVTHGYRGCHMGHTWATEDATWSHMSYRESQGLEVLFLE